MSVLSQSYINVVSIEQLIATASKTKCRRLAGYGLEEASAPPIED